MTEIDTYSEDYRRDCYARHLIREIRTERTPKERSDKLDRLLEKQGQGFRNDMRERVRKLWKATNDADKAQG